MGVASGLYSPIPFEAPVSYALSRTKSHEKMHSRVQECSQSTAFSELWEKRGSPEP